MTAEARVVDRAHPRGPRPGSGESGLAACRRGPERGDRKARHGGGRGGHAGQVTERPAGGDGHRGGRRGRGARRPAPHPRGDPPSPPVLVLVPRAQGSRGAAAFPRGGRGRPRRTPAREARGLPEAPVASLLPTSLPKQCPPATAGHEGGCRGERFAPHGSVVGGIEGIGVRRAEPTGSVVPGNKRQQRRTHGLQFGPF